MLIDVEITAYAEEMQDADDDAVGEYTGQRERRFVRSPENRLNVAEWYREYEEKTGTLLGCD